MQEFEQENYTDAPKYNFGETQNTAELIRYLDPNIQKQKLLIQLLWQNGIAFKLIYMIPNCFFGQNRLFPMGCFTALQIREGFRLIFLFLNL